jgi:hypothetical protein
MAMLQRRFASSVYALRRSLERMRDKRQKILDDPEGYDLRARKPHPEDPETVIEVRFVEVKGRAGVGEVALTTNKYKTAERLKKEYWLYVVFNCATKPEAHSVQNPARLGWGPL